MTHHAARVLIAVVVCLCLVSPAWAQRDMGTVLGTVTDPTGAVVAGAKVTVTEDATKLSVSLTTDESGNYIRPLLKPGVYTIEVEMAGFKKAVQKNVSVNAGDRIQANLTLEIGEVTQAVEITAAPPALQTESTELGGTLQSRQVSELPLGGQRKFTYLARLSPAVVPAEPGARDAAGGGFAANGVRSNGQNNFLLNGVDNNVNVIDFINQTAYVIGPSVEAIGEMKIITNGYNAEYGRGAGGVINISLKSGSNSFHGAAFEFLENDKLNANKWETNRAGGAKGPFKQNQYGGAIGGPIIKDRTFFFFDYQGTSIRSTGGAVPGLGQAWTLTVPKPAYKNGDFSSLLTTNVLGTDPLGRPILQGAIYDIATTRTVNGQFVRDPFPGNIIPTNRFDPAAKKLIDLYPNPTQNVNARIASNNFFTITSGRAEIDQFDVRIDHKLSDKDSLFGSLSWSNEDKFQTPPLPGALDAGGFGGETEKNLGRNAMMSWTRVWSPNLITESRIAFSRLVTSRTQANADKDLQKEFGIGGLQTFSPLNGGLPNIQMQDYTTIGGAEWLPTLEYSNVWDFIQNVSINKGKHAYKFGYEYRPIGFPFFQVPTPRGTFRFNRDRTNYPVGPYNADTGDAVAAFLLGTTQNNTITTQNFVSSDKVAHAWYFQDDWKLSPKFTLNVGLRYELFSPIGESWGRQSTFDQDRLTLVIPEGPNQDAPLPPNFATQFPQIKVERGQVDKYMIPWDKTNWSPRIGFAWEAMDRSVIRAGYGIFYGGEENQGGNPNRGINAPFNQEQRLNPVDSVQPNPFISRFSDGFPTNVFSLPAAISFRTVVSNFRNPLVHKWNLAIQRELGQSTSLEVAYIGSKGQRLVHLNDPNQPVNAAAVGLPTNPRRRLPFIEGTNTTNSNGFSRYDGLAIKLEKTMSNGLQFLGSYTWSHALTNVGTTLSGGTGGGIVRDVLNWDQEYSHANFHVKNRFVYSTIWDLPFGRSRKIGSNMNPVVDRIVGNWQTNAILSLQSGNAFNLVTGFASCSCGGAVRPDVVEGKDPNGPPSGGRTPDKWFDTTALKAPTPGTYGNLGNYSNYGPGLYNVDFGLFKDFPINERYRVQFRTEFFNMFNTPQFNVQQISNNDRNADFGRINETLQGTERHIRFSLRFQF